MLLRRGDFVATPHDCTTWASRLLNRSHEHEEGKRRQAAVLLNMKCSAAVLSGFGESLVQVGLDEADIETAIIVDMATLVKLVRAV